MSKNWIGVASKNHVNIGREGGFMQVNHGKLAPLKRISPKDWIFYYSPTLILGGKDKLQAFTAMGMVKEGEPYQAKMSETFHPYRRDVTWHHAQDAPIGPLLQELEFTRDNKNWGYQMRFGLFEISDHDRKLIINCAANSVEPAPELF